MEEHETWITTRPSISLRLNFLAGRSAQGEPEMLQRWNDMDLYNELLKKRGQARFPPRRALPMETRTWAMP